MSILVVYTEPAADQIMDLELWWRTNVTHDPNRVSLALAAGIELLQRYPLTGKAYRSHQVKGARRLLLSELQYYLYYTYDPNAQQLLLLSVWSTKRRRPSLKAP
jgi:plasmid stabilization system protein ParE